MYNLIKSYYQRLRHPYWSDFLTMGRGIRARSRRCSKYWKSHLELCKEFQRKNLAHLSGVQSVAVMGAGSLLDIDQDLLIKKFNKISFFDADLAVAKTWKKFSRKLTPEKKFSGHHIDLTNSLSLWTKELSSFLDKYDRPDLPALCEFLGGFFCYDRNQQIRKYDVIISANILGQIPIYWRDRVHSLIKKKWKIDTNEHGFYESSLQLALDYTMALLQKQHLEILSSSSSKVVIIICDKRYFYYLNNNSHWQETVALQVPIELPAQFYFTSDSDSWFWHIAPQGVEQKAYGVIHDVIAKAFVAQSSEF